MAARKEPISDDMEEIGANIKRYRKQCGLTLERLAEKLGGRYTAKVLSQYEHGYINIGSQAIIDMAFALSVTPNQLYPAWISENQQDEAISDFLQLDKGNQDAVRNLIRSLLANQALLPHGV